MTYPGGASRHTDRDAFFDWLKAETVTGLQGASGDAAALREVVLFYLRCVYQAAIDRDVICDVFGDLPDSILRQASLSEADENAAMDAFEALDPVIAAQHRSA
jgi:hypothetical protein